MKKKIKPNSEDKDDVLFKSEFFNKERHPSEGENEQEMHNFETDRNLITRPN